MTKAALNTSKDGKKKRKNMDEKERTKDKKAEREVVGYLEMYRYSSAYERVLVSLGILCSIIHGAALPATTVVIGESFSDYAGAGQLIAVIDESREYLHSINLTYTDILGDPSLLRPECPNLDRYYNRTDSCAGVELEDSLTEATFDTTIYYLVIGAVMMFAGIGQVSLFAISSERQAHRIRRLFFANILRQDIGWFDTHDVAELTSRLSGDIILIQYGIGERVSIAIKYLATFVAGYVVGFIKGWKLALVMVSVSPLLIFAGGLFAYATATMTTKEQTAYAKAGAIAEEVLSSIRTVFAFGGEHKETERYQSHLGQAQKLGVRKGLAMGAAMGFAELVKFSTYGFGLWYGVRMVREDGYLVKDAITTFFAILTGTFTLGLSVSGIQSVTEGRAAAYKVFQLIEMKPEIDSSSTQGRKLHTITGTIAFRDIHFSYPSRPEFKVLSNVNIEAQPGLTVAFVGSSGCGKSTLIQLLLRFYDPQHGQILLDGHDIKDLNIKWLRQSIGLVSQEPVLFDTSIAENIRYGREGVTEAEILQATKDANAYDFISKLPEQLNTQVGEGGAQLSGGQKQRIAIARALVRDPKILLLDEATSALDTESEAVVQDALDKARQGRTTLVIAHRLSTIKTADIIIGLEAGRVKEKGTNSQLMEREGIYYNLVMNQSLMVLGKKECRWQSFLEEGGTKTHSKDVVEGRILDQKQPKQKLQARDAMKGCDETVSAGAETKTERKRLLSGTSKQDDFDEIDEELPEVSMRDLLGVNAPEWPYIVLGLLGAVVHGGVQSFFAVAMSEILNIFTNDRDQDEDEVTKYTLYLVALGGIALVGCMLQNWNLAIAGEALTKRLREGSFQAILRQEMAWFDKPCNSTGALVNRLATDASIVQGAAGTRLGLLIECLVAILLAVGLAFYYSWRLALVAMGFYPLVALGGITQVKVMKGTRTMGAMALEAASKVAVDALLNMRTVAALTREKSFYDTYERKLDVLLENLTRNSVIGALLYSISHAVIFLSIGGMYAYGAYLIENGDISSKDVHRVLTLLVFTGVFLGQAASFGADISKAKTASRRIFYMLNRQTRIDVDSPHGTKPDVKFFNSSITVQQAHFRYPLRPDVRVLQNLSFKVKPGQTVALVGSSGCGKSTIVALLERFYNLDSGTMSIQGHDISQLNIRWLRSQLGLVSQEPVLFDCSIADNIAYGDNARVVPMEEIIQAARQANVHDFIQALPTGYDTNVGEKGTQLSGGQKQRIAIARALVRNPKILLLDEATSALDTESEKVVQEALDKARRGRTCIVIAHRLSTIQDADNIVVMKSGKVVEQGTHDELMAAKEFYSTLQRIQNS